MPNSNILFYITAEIAILLLVICVFLMVLITKLKKLISGLEDKILGLRKAVGKSRRETKVALGKLEDQENTALNGFLQNLDEEAESTRAYHQSLSPDKDIVLDIAKDTPNERRVASLRHAFLLAEKEALYASGGDESDWQVLEAKYSQIIQFFEIPQLEKDGLELPPATTEEKGDQNKIEEYKARIENLERFQNLFFNMEAMWAQSKKQAEEYRQQLIALGNDLGAGNEFSKVLDSYANVYDNVGGVISNAGSDNELTSTHQQVPCSIDGQSKDKVSGLSSQQEIQRLKNTASEQHKIIAGLKQRLIDANNDEDKKLVVDELTTQVEQQQRFLQEAETCTQLIEDELTLAQKENEQLRSTLTANEQGPAYDKEDVQQLESVVTDLTTESKSMLGAIATLEMENQELSQEASSGEVTGSKDNEAMLNKKLAALQQELLNLQTQHIELEERYLELKEA